MNTKLIKSVFSDDPEIVAAMERRGTPAERILIKGDKGDKGESIEGPPGLTGPKGDSIVGPRGPRGESVIGPKGDRGIDGKDGKNGENGKSPEVDTEEIIKALVDYIKEKKPIDISHIRNASSFMKDGIRYKVEELMHGGSAGAVSGSLIYAYDISPQFNSIATTFTLPQYSRIIQFTITGWPPEGALRPTVDFTTPTDTTVALTAQVTAPPAGTTGIILYAAV